MKKRFDIIALPLFNDQPESFHDLKIHLQTYLRISVSRISAREELNLLVKWQGPESSKHVQSIRIANANDPAEALKKVWESR